MSDLICDQLETINTRITDACKRVGRSRDDIQLIAVSKRVPTEKIRDAFDYGQTVFGESKVQEAQGKIPDLPAAVQWHLIGRLQKNKIRKALPLFDTIHSIDSLELAEAVNRVAGEEGQFPKIYLQTNLAGEMTKTGFSREELISEYDQLLDLDRLQIMGLMAIPPSRDDEALTRLDFAAVRELRDELVEQSGIPLDGLSMGMSDDYEIAIEEGATIVRIGSAIFGERT